MVVSCEAGLQRNLYTYDMTCKQISGVCQRDVTQHFPALADQQQELEEQILEFFEEHIQHKFPGPDCKYLLDDYGGLTLADLIDRVCCLTAQTVLCCLDQRALCSVLPLVNQCTRVQMHRCSQRKVWQASIAEQEC